MYVASVSVCGGPFVVGPVRPLGYLSVSISPIRNFTRNLGKIYLCQKRPCLPSPFQRQQSQHSQAS